jgi:hypothetical protein
MAGGGVLLSNNKSRGLPPSLKLSWWCVFFSEKENEVRLGEREFTWGHAKGKKRERERDSYGGHVGCGDRMETRPWVWASGDRDRLVG